MITPFLNINNYNINFIKKYSFLGSILALSLKN